MTDARDHHKPTDKELEKMLEDAEQEAGVASVVALYDRAEAIYSASAQHLAEPYGYASNSTIGEPIRRQ